MFQRPAGGASPLRLAAAALVIAIVTALAPRAAADPLTPVESAQLDRGETVTREQTIDNGRQRYVGGIAYTVVDASPMELFNLLEDVSAYARVLPRTKSARIVGHQGGDFFVELRQGNALVTASYTIRVRPDAAKREVRFWLDPTRPHAIDDAWGFFRYEAIASESGAPRAILTYGILVDIGPGLVRDLFEERLRAMMLSVPQHLRRYVAANAQ